MVKKSYRTIKSLPEYDRPRERFFKLGSEAVSDRELIAIILSTGTKKISALELADHILTEFNSISELMNVTVQELCQLQGVGKAKAVKIKAALELSSRCLSRELSKTEKVTGPEDVNKLLKFKFQHESREHFYLMLLNTKNLLIRIEPISIGSLNSTIVHPREVFRPAVRASASGVILIHNHPSGDPAPSTDDLELTDRLVSVGEMIGINVLDHVIIGTEDFFSFSRENYL